MGRYIKTRIVTDGLIYLNDAGNSKSYSGVGTALKNLVGYGATNTSFNQTFVSSGTSSYFISTSTSSYISNTNVSISASTGKGFTICMMVKPQTLTNTEWNYWFQQQSGSKSIEFGRYGTSNGWEIKDNTKIEGQKVFTSVGTATWTVPVGVTSITAVCIGGGGGAGGSSSSRGGGGGGGGGLSYGSTISVTPGDVLYIRVGAGGIGGTSYVGTPATSPTNGTAGESSYIKTGSHSGTSLLEGFGGGGGFSGNNISNEGSGGSVGGTARTGPAGSFQGHGGGGGRSTTSASGSPSNVAGGGGGAGGYPSSGASGEPSLAYGGSGGGGVSGASAYGAGASGGGGGGGGGYISTQNGEVTNPGGGVSIFGRGSDGLSGTSPGGAGGGGSGGTQGTPSTGNGSNQRSVGGLYGGGGGSTRPASSDAYVRDGGNGGQGAVRIVWGTNRSNPTTNVSDPIPVTQSTFFSDWTFVVFGVTSNYYTFISTNGSNKSLGTSNDWSTAPQINFDKIFGTGTSNYSCQWNNVMIYNRELTNEEIQINFEAYRRKFNL